MITNILSYISIACLIFGVLLNFRYVLSLRRNVPRNARWTAAVWLIMLVGLGQWFGRTSSAVGVTSIDRSAYLQIASIAIAAFTILLVYHKSFRINNFRAPLLFLFIYGLAGLLTSPVSEVPALSAFKAMSVVVSVLLAVMTIKPLERTKLPGIVYDTTYIYFSILSLLAIAGSILIPEVTHRQNNGVFGFMLEGWPPLNSNSLSYISAVVFVISFRRMFCEIYFRRRVLYFGLTSIGAVTLLLSQGRTSVISSTIAILFLSFYIKKMMFMRYFLLVGIILSISLILITGSAGDWTGDITSYMQRGVSEEQISTLSGRTKAWDRSWDIFLDSPITGYGFYAAGKTLLAPHNAYFTVLLNSGLFGFMPWIMGVLGGMIMIFRHITTKHWISPSPENNYYKEIVAVMIVQFFRTITGQDLTIHSYSMLMFLGALAYIIVRERHRMLSRTHNYNAN